jgi:hypothetical protein
VHAAIDPHSPLPAATASQKKQLKAADLVLGILRSLPGSDTIELDAPETHT